MSLIVVERNIHISCIKTRLTFSIFRLIWSHSGVFLEQKTATYSSNNVLHSFRFFILTVLELITKALGNFTEIASKQQTLKLSTFSESICGIFYYKWYLSLNESSLKPVLLPLFRGFNILVHEIRRQFD